MNFKNNFSVNLSVLRKSKKLKLSQLSEALGITIQSISAMEKGKNAPSFEVFLALAEYYNVPLDYLVGRDVSSDHPLPTVTPDELALVEKLRALPPKKRKAIEMLLD